MFPKNLIDLQLKKLFYLTRGVALLSCIFMVLSCSETNTVNSDSSNKLFDEYNSDPYLDSSNSFDDDYDSWGVSQEDQSIIDEFLAQDLGEPQYGDLTDGEILVAGPAVGIEVVLGCSEGALYVAAGAATGALATAFAASGVLVGGVGVGATAPASVPLYAAAGGLIGLAASSPSWSQCFVGLARLGFAFIQQGYFSAARGLQTVIQRPTRSRSTSGTTTASTECQGGGAKCSQMNRRYHSFCDPLEDATKFITGVWNGDLCKSSLFFSNYSCGDLSNMIRDAAACEAGRRLVTQRCYGGRWDSGHVPPWENAKKQLRDCSTLYRRNCGELPDPQSLQSDAENQYPECR